MKIVIVDTNILFSSLLAGGTKLREVLSNDKYNFYAPNFLIAEIFKHKNKILKCTSATESEVDEFLVKSLQNIHFVNEGLISTENFIQAYRLCGNVDEKDTPFVALTLELDGNLWSGDKPLKQELTRKGFTAFFDME